MYVADRVVPGSGAARCMFVPPAMRRRRHSRACHPVLHQLLFCLPCSLGFTAMVGAQGYDWHGGAVVQCDGRLPSVLWSPLLAILCCPPPLLILPAPQTAVTPSRRWVMRAGWLPPGVQHWALHATSVTALHDAAVCSLLLPMPTAHPALLLLRSPRWRSTATSAVPAASPASTAPPRLTVAACRWVGRWASQGGSWLPRAFTQSEAAAEVQAPLAKVEQQTTIGRLGFPYRCAGPHPVCD